MVDFRGSIRVVNGYRFCNVTNETTSGKLFTSEEANYYAYGHEIATSGRRTPLAPDGRQAARSKSKKVVPAAGKA